MTATSSSSVPVERGDSAALRLVRLSGLITATLLCWLVTTIAQLQKYLSMTKAGLAALAGCISITLLILALVRSSRDLPRWSLSATWLLLALCFAFIYPRSQRHLPGKGSDREDALRVELRAAVHHQYPYDARTFLGHPPTPLPGAMLLAAPFFLLGRVALQNLAWAAAFLAFLSRFFQRRSTAVAFVLIFLITALGNLNDFVVGGDYITNILYVAVAVWMVSRTADRNTPAWQTGLALALYGVALSSRIVYVVSVPPVFALLQQRTTLRRAIACVAAVLAVTLVVTLLVFAPHPVGRLLEQLRQNADKLEYLPHALQGGTLPIAAILVAASSLLVRMSLARLYLFSGLAALAMLGPVMLAVVIAQGGLAHPLTTDLEYLAASAIFIALWLFSRFELAAFSVAERPEAGLQLH